MSEDLPPPKPELDALTRSLYDALRQIARRERARAGRPQTLQTTALINESYLKLRQSDGWQSREHFLGCAAMAMRHVLVDAARARLSLKRGEGARLVSIEDAGDIAQVEDAELLRLNEALEALHQLDQRLARVVECRFFAGYGEDETAQVLGVSERTVRRDWVQAKAWLYRELQNS